MTESSCLLRLWSSKIILRKLNLEHIVNGKNERKVTKAILYVKKLNFLQT